MVIHNKHHKCTSEANFVFKSAHDQTYCIRDGSRVNIKPIVKKTIQKIKIRKYR